MNVYERADPGDGVSLAPEPVSLGFVETRVQGKIVRVPSVRVGAANIIVRGRVLRTAVIQDEELIEGERAHDPQLFLSRLKDSGLKADVFTFAQGLPDLTPRHDHYFEWDSLAVVKITSFKDWWTHLTDPVQRAVKKAKRVGVVVKEMDLDDAFVEGIREINDETPVRQGKPFWHYQKDFESVKAENTTYADRNIFIGAYLEGKLIGYIRMIRVGKVAEIINILSQVRHFDKRPANALLAKAVEICEQRGFTHLVYCNYLYRDPNSSLTEFKRRNGFENVLAPRYYIPLTLKGRVVMKLKLHHGVKALLPVTVLRMLAVLRTRLVERTAASLKPGGRS
jgi:hypothetical protein